MKVIHKCQSIQGPHGVLLLVIKIPTHCISVRGATYCIQSDHKIMTVVTNRQCWMQVRVCFCWFVAVANPRHMYPKEDDFPGPTCWFYDRLI